MNHVSYFEPVTESSPSSLMGNPSGSRHEQRSRLAAVLSDEEASSDDDLGPPIFESIPGSSRSERYMRRAQHFSGNAELVGFSKRLSLILKMAKPEGCQRIDPDF